MLKIPIPKYNHILRINPATDPKQLKAFKAAIRCTNEQGFNLNGIKEEPEELVNRSWGKLKSTSSEARKESRKLYKKYGADNVIDWDRENWGVTCNIKEAIWMDEFTVYLSAEEKLIPVILKLAKEFNIEMYLSYVEDCDAYFEENCGILKIKRFPEFFELGNDRFEKYVFGIVLLRRTPLTFEKWEETEIPIKNVDKYYYEHFIEENARNRMESAFNDTEHICIANTMVNEELGPKRVWDALSKLF